MIAHVPVRVAEPSAPPAPDRLGDPILVAASVSEHRSAWPGRRAATILISGCDFACPYCFDPEHVRAGRVLSRLDDIVETVTRRTAALDGVVVGGGEPTTCSGLIPLLRALRAARLPVKLDTNGTAPDVLATILDAGLADFVSLDVKTTPDRYERLTGSRGAWSRVERSIELLRTSEAEHEFRTTAYPFAVPIFEVTTIAARLAGGARYVLQQFEPRRTLDPAAASVRPYSADELRRAALRCSVSLPTVVRGA